MEFSALNVDFNGSSLDSIGSRKPAHEGIKERYPRKVIILPLLASLSWKRLQICMGMLLITTSTSDALFSRINIDDFERPWTFKIKVFFVDFCDLRLQRTFQEWTATKWLEIDSLRTGTIGFRASREHWLKFLVNFRSIYRRVKVRVLLGLLS